MDLVNLKISQEKFDLLFNSGLLDYSEVREIYTMDDFFKDDETHKRLVKEVVKAKEKLKEYEFKKRHNIK